MTSLLLTLGSCIAGALSLSYLHNSAAVEAGLWHIGSALCGMAVVYNAQHDRELPFFETSLAFSLPVFGGLCTSCYTLATTGKSKTGAFSEYQEHLGKNIDRADAEKAFVPQPERLRSLFNILKSDQPLLEKRTAIEALAQLETPESVATLRQALSLDSVEVRFFAASVLSKIENKLTDSLKKRDLRAEHSAASTVDYFNMAQSYFDFSYYKIAEGEREKTYLRKALSYLDKIDRKQVDSKIHELAGRIHLGLNHYGEALDSFKNLETDAANEQSALLWCAEASYYMGDYRETKRYCQRASNLGAIPLRMRETVTFWVGHGARHEQ